MTKLDYLERTVTLLVEDGVSHEDAVVQAHELWEDADQEFRNVGGHVVPVGGKSGGEEHPAAAHRKYLEGEVSRSKRRVASWQKDLDEKRFVPVTGHTEEHVRSGLAQHTQWLQKMEGELKAHKEKHGETLEKGDDIESDEDRSIRDKGGQFAGSKPGSGNKPEDYDRAQTSRAKQNQERKEFEAWKEKQGAEEKHEPETHETHAKALKHLNSSGKDVDPDHVWIQQSNGTYSNTKEVSSDKNMHLRIAEAARQGKTAVAISRKSAEKDDFSGDAIHPPVAEGLPEWLSPSQILVHPAMQYRRGTDQQLGIRNAVWQKMLQDDTPYDVDKGGTLVCWRDMGGNTFTIDGHHRRLHAMIAKQFITSSLKKGSDGHATKRLVPCRILNESDGWSLEMASEFGRSINEGGAATLDEQEFRNVGGHVIPVGGKGGEEEAADPHQEKADKLYERHQSEFTSMRARHKEEMAKHGTAGALNRSPEWRETAQRHTQEHSDLKARHEAERNKANVKHKFSEFGYEKDSETASDAFEDFFTCDDIVLLAGDTKGGLLRVRQKATRADSVNRNRRLYPREILQAAIDRANPRAEAGAMLSEWEHPERARTASGECFVDNPDSKTARVDAISSVGADGWVTVDRTILATKAGKDLARRIKSGDKAGISTRFRVRGSNKSVNGQSIFVADHMEIFTFDDVSNPAVDGAGDYKLLTDSELEEIKNAKELGGPEALGDPYDGDPNNTSNGVSADAQREQEYNTDMKNLRGLLTAFAAAIVAADPIRVNETNKACADGLLEAYRGSQDIAHLVPRYRELVTDATEKIPGFHSGAESPQATMANEMGEDPYSGWGASELHKKHGSNAMVTPGTPSTPDPGPQSSLKADEDVKDAIDFVKKAREREAQELAAKDHSEAVEAQISGILGDEAHPLNKLEGDTRDGILDTVRKVSPKPEDVSTLVDSLVKPISEAAAKATLAAKGYRGAGQTVIDPANPLSGVTRVNEPVPVMASVDKMIAACDDMLRDNISLAHEHGWMDPNNPDEARRREVCRKMAEPIMEQAFTRLAARSQLGADSLGEDSLLREIEGLKTSLIGGDTYTSVVASMNNQPTIMLWLLLQAFQDMRFMEFCGAIGPGVSAGNGVPGWEERQGVGRVFRVPSETYVAPTGFGQEQYWDMGLATAQDGEIPEQNVNVYWDTFFPTPKKIATSATYEAIRAMGNGPLNYPTVARALFHMAARKSRTVDTSLGNEMVNAALEFGAVVQTVEAYTTGGSLGLDLANNSVGVGAAPLTVNLNPQKTATTTPVASTDKFRIYGTGGSLGGFAPVAGLRLRSGGGAGVSGTGTHYSTNTVGPTPIVPPRAQLTLTGPGADSASVLNAITVSLPAAQVLGYLGSDGNIYSVPGTTATCAVDWANGVLLFKAGQVTVAGGLITTATSVAYSYATNFDYFVTTDAMVTALLGTGETEQAYYNKLVAKLDSVAAAMGSSFNYVKPDMSVMSLNAAAKVLKSTIWYALNNPKGSELYPNETYFATRNGIGMARVNAPWWLGDSGILIGRKGTTKYAIDSPFEIRGPYVKYGSNGLFVAGEGYYGAENSAIFTPQVKDINGAIKNSVSRMLMLY